MPSSSFRSSYDGVDAALVDEGEDAGAQLLVAPGRRGDVDAAHARVGDRDDDRRGRGVAGPVGGLERDRPRGRALEPQGEAAVVVDLDGVAVGGQLGVDLDRARDCGPSPSMPTGSTVGGTVSAGAVPSTVKRQRVDRVAERRPRHRDLDRWSPSASGAGGRHTMQRTEHGGLLDALAVDGERGLGGLVLGLELEEDLEGGGVERGDGRAVADAGGVDVDPGGPVHEHGDEGDGRQRDEGGEHGPDLDVALLGPEHHRALGPALVHGERPGAEVEPPAGERPAALATTTEAAAVLGLGARTGVAQR